MPAVRIGLELKKSSEILASELDEFEGTNTEIDHVDEATRTEEDFIDFKTYGELTVESISPDTGSMAGGDDVTITYSGDLGSDLPIVEIGGVRCTDVVVVDDTTITAVTGAHTLYTSTLIADVEVTNSDGQIGTLSAGFTYTDP
jgi:hypothetical protein